VCSKAGLDDVENRKFLTLPGLELRHLGRPDRSLRYVGSWRRHVPPKNRLTFNGLYGVISRKIILIVGRNLAGKSLDFRGIFIANVGVTLR
jgi:hypothetical protein